MMHRRTVLGALGSAMVAGPVIAGGTGLRIMMVGNSFTYGQDLPKMLRSVIGHGTSVRTVAAGGQRLIDHAEDDASLRSLANAQHDVVILQDHSVEPLTHAGRLRSIVAMDRLSSASGARVVLFSTWARATGHPLYEQDGAPTTPEEMTAIVARHYARAGAALNASVAQVGLAWQRAAVSGIRVHARDGYHANAAGAYLAALLLARALDCVVDDGTWQPRDMMPTLAKALRDIVVEAS